MEVFKQHYKNTTLGFKDNVNCSNKLLLKCVFNTDLNSRNVTNTIVYPQGQGQTWFKAKASKGQSDKLVFDLLMLIIFVFDVNKLCFN